MVTKFKFHRIFEGKDEVIGTFEVNNGEISFPSDIDKHHCDMFPPGPMSTSTKNKISYLLDNKEKTTYLEQVK